MVVWRIRARVMRTVLTVLCTVVVHKMIGTHVAVLTVDWFFRLDLVFVCLDLAFCVFFCFSLDYFGLMLFGFVVPGLVSSALCQEIGWEEHLRNDLLCD